MGGSRARRAPSVPSRARHLRRQNAASSGSGAPPEHKQDLLRWPPEPRGVLPDAVRGTAQTELAIAGHVVRADLLARPWLGHSGRRGTTAERGQGGGRGHP
eukprot:2268120-Pyramimonas_sp.AAC.1